MAIIAYLEHSPAPRLREAIACYWTLCSSGTHTDERKPNRILPDGCIDIIFNFGEPLQRVTDTKTYTNRLPWYIAGAMTRPVEVQSSGRADMIGIRFNPGYAKSFLLRPARELTDLSPALQDLWGNSGTELGTRLAETKTRKARLNILDQELLLRFQQAEKPGGHIKLAVSILLRTGGRTKIASIASRCGISVRHLGRQFEEAVGLSPKLFARIVRFQKVLAMAKKAPHPDWLTSVFEAGYYDQSHLIKDFHEFSRSSPNYLHPR